VVTHVGIRVGDSVRLRAMFEGCVVGISLLLTDGDMLGI